MTPIAIEMASGAVAYFARGEPWAALPERIELAIDFLIDWPGTVTLDRLDEVEIWTGAPMGGRWRTPPFRLDDDPQAPREIVLRRLVTRPSGLLAEERGALLVPDRPDGPGRAYLFRGVQVTHVGIPRHRRPDRGQSLDAPEAPMPTTGLPDDPFAEVIRFVVEPPPSSRVARARRRWPGR